jgi:hypothetical protein
MNAPSDFFTQEDPHVIQALVGAPRPQAADLMP